MTEKIVRLTRWFLTPATIQAMELFSQAEAIMIQPFIKIMKNKHFKIKILDKTI
jgi:hypothetical protein